VQLKLSDYNGELALSRKEKTRRKTGLRRVFKIRFLIVLSFWVESVPVLSPSVGIIIPYNRNHSPVGFPGEYLSGRAERSLLNSHQKNIQGVTQFGSK
jgi:hypothetical protein